MNISKMYNRPDYKQLFKNRPFLVSKDFSIWVNDNNLNREINIIRFGVIAVKKNIKKAVARNKSKRIAKELFRSFKSQIVNKPQMVNKDIVLVIKKFESKEHLDIWKEKLLGIYRWVDYFMVGRLLGR